MIVNGITVQQAIRACELQGIVPSSTVYSRVKVARAKGVYNVQMMIGIDHIELDGNGTSASSVSTVTLPVDVLSSDGSNGFGITTKTTSPSRTSKPKMTRKSSSQAAVERLDAKRTKLDYDSQYKAAFKDATNLVADPTNLEPVKQICERLNRKFNLLDGKKRLARSTIYQAVKDGLAGMSPKKKGPVPTIPDALLAVVATHVETCHVGGGELKGRDVKRLIGRSIAGTRHEKNIKVESVWRKVRTAYPEAILLLRR